MTSKDWIRTGEYYHEQVMYLIECLIKQKASFRIEASTAQLYIQECEETTIKFLTEFKAPMRFRNEEIYINLLE